MAEDEHAVVKAQVSQLSLAIEIAKNRAANLELELENVQAQKATVGQEYSLLSRIRKKCNMFRQSFVYAH